MKKYKVTITRVFEFNESELSYSDLTENIEEAEYLAAELMLDELDAPATKLLRNFTIETEVR